MDRSADIVKALAGIQLTLLAIVFRVSSGDATFSILLGLIGMAVTLAAWAGPTVRPAVATSPVPPVDRSAGDAQPSTPESLC